MNKGEIMVKRSKEITTYEYFKVDEVFFKGKHRDYIDQLWKLNQIQNSYFARLVDLYSVAAILGLKLKRRSKEEKDDTGIKRTIQMQQLANTYQTLSTIMKMVLIMDDSRKLTFEQKLESAFMIPEDKETYEENMELFNSYARGGIEYLYEQLVLRKPDIDEIYSDFRVANMVALLKNPISIDELDS